MALGKCQMQTTDGDTVNLPYQLVLEATRKWMMQNGKENVDLIDAEKKIEKFTTKFKYVKKVN